MADAFIYNLSSRNDFVEQVATKKEVVWITDQNNGSYNGSISFNSTSIANSGRFCDWSSSYIVIPYVVAFYSAGDISSEITRFSIGVKNGSWQLIHSMSVDWNQVNVIQLTSFLNIYCSYKAMTSWSYNDMYKNGATCTFWKDSVDSIIYQAAAGISGAGWINNNIQDVGVAAGGVQQLNFTGLGAINTNSQLVGYNEGLRKRTQWLAYSRTTSTYQNAFSNTSSSGNSSFFYTGSETAVPAVPGAGATYFLKYNAVIRLSDLSDFFEKVPLCKGGVLNFTINYNAGSLTITSSNALGVGLNTLTPSAVSVNSGQTIPYLFGASSHNNPNASVGQGGARVINLASGVVRATPSGGVECVNNSPLSSARMYVPLYTLHPAMEDELLTLNPTKLIRYKDIYQYTISGTQASGSFNQLLTNGLARPQTLIICPFSSTAVSGVSALNSPFSSAPATCDPYFLVNNFNVQVSGVNVFTQNLDYSFVEFQNELGRINAVNGNASIGLTSGLIDQHDYEHGYGYIVVDLSRTLNLDDPVPKSILVYGSNNSTLPATYYCFVEYIRMVNINLATGDISLP